MSKQTSIEWLFERFENGDMYNLEDAQFIKHQALKMHKEEIEKAQSFAISNADMSNNRGYFDCEQYYQETYQQSVTNCNQMSSPKTSDN